MNELFSCPNALWPVHVTTGSILASFASLSPHHCFKRLIEDLPLRNASTAYNGCEINIDGVPFKTTFHQLSNNSILTSIKDTHHHQNKVHNFHQFLPLTPVLA